MGIEVWTSKYLIYIINSQNCGDILQCLVQWHEKDTTELTNSIINHNLNCIKYYEKRPNQ